MPSDPRELQLPDVSRLSNTGAIESSRLAMEQALEAPRIEGYQILDKLGQGGMGTVWHAIQLGTRRKVALKLMSAAMFASDRARHRFDREVELTARLDHPNIAQVFDSGLDRGIYFYAMERVDGTPLDLYVESHKMSRRDILELMRTICQAVHHAHQRGVIHRDLKPPNILVDPDGQPHVLDFGLARTVLHEQGELNVTIEADLAGTPAYMSPEQAAGHMDKLDTRTDVYSLGVILYRLLLGQPPHELSGSQLEILRRISDTEITPPRTIDKKMDRELEAILCMALAKNPEQRYASAGEFARNINNYLTGEPLLAHSPAFFYILRKQLAKYILPVSVTAAILIILIAIGVFSYFRVKSARDMAEGLIHFNDDLARQPDESMLQMIVDRTMSAAHADAGSLFVRTESPDGDVLRFEIARNNTLEARDGAVAAAQRFAHFSLPISQASIAGYVAATGNRLNLPDAYNLPASVPYFFNQEFDRRNNYHSQSMLVVPLTHPDGRILGVLQLINRKSAGGQIIPFSSDEESLVQAMASQAAIQLRSRTAPAK